MRSMNTGLRAEQKFVLPFSYPIEKWLELAPRDGQLLAIAHHSRVALYPVKAFEVVTHIDDVRFVNAKEYNAIQFILVYFNIFAAEQHLP
jgi:hypothetical protein